MTQVHNAFKYVLLLVFTFLFLWIISPFFPAIIFAIIFAIVFMPVYIFFSKKLKWNNSISALIVLILTFIFILTPVFLLLGLVAKETVYFVQTFDLDAFNKLIANYSVVEIFGYKIVISEYTNSIIDIIKNAGEMLASHAGTIGGNVARTVFLFFVFLFVYFFFLKDGSTLVSKCRGLLPFTASQNRKLFEEFYKTSKTVFIGYLIAAFLSGLAAYIIFKLFGIPGALIWALLTGLLSLIPTIGTIIIYGIGIIIAGILYGAWGALGFFAYFIVIEIIGMQSIIRPKLVDEKISMHPILVFFSLVGGITIFGSIGIIYGPLIMVMFVSIFDFIIGTSHAEK